MRCETRCPPNLYGPNCNIFCNPQNNCNSGHFICDIAGNLVCESNWLPPNCNTKILNPSLDPDCPQPLLAGGGCQNGGTCFNQTCCCSPGYTGSFCDSKINYCLNNKCINGICVNMNTGYTCTCNQGYTDIYCTTPINPCLLKPCKNQGLCNQLTTGSYQV